MRSIETPNTPALPDITGLLAKFVRERTERNEDQAVAAQLVGTREDVLELIESTPIPAHVTPSADPLNRTASEEEDMKNWSRHADHPAM